MAPNAPGDERPSRANASTGEITENIITSEAVQTVSDPEGNPFASSRSSLSSSSSAGRMVSVDEDRAAVSVAQDHANPLRQHYPTHSPSRHTSRENPFASSTPSLSDADSIGRAVSTDDTRVFTNRSFPLAGTAPTPHSAENPFDSSNASVDDDDGSRGSAAPGEEHRAPGPAARFDPVSTGSRIAGAEQERSLNLPIPDSRQASIQSPPPVSMWRQDRRRSSTVVSFALSDSEHESERLGQASIRPPPPVSIVHQNRRRSSTTDPFASSEFELEHERRRRRSSTIDPLDSNGANAGPPVPTIPGLAARPMGQTFMPNMPTPIAEEPNPMDSIFASVRFNQETSTGSAEHSSGRSALGRQTRNNSSAAGPTEGSRRGSFVGFFTRGSSARRESQVGPLDGTQRAVSTGDIPTQESNDAAKKRSQSFAALPKFTHPFQRVDGKAKNLDSARRTSEPLQRRPSTFQRMKSVSELLVSDNPIPQRYRSRSVSSVAFFVTPMKRNNSVNPIFQEDIVAEKENVQDFLEAAKEVQERQTRSQWQKEIFRCAYFLTLLALVYFVFIGRPLWQGIGSIYYHFIHTSTSSRTGVVGVFIGWAALQGCLPLIFANFEAEVDDVESRDASETALIIPAYKAANVLPETITAALKIFKKEQIFVIANGNSPTPMDETADVCKQFGVNHAWVPIGSKITAEFVGVALTTKYKYIMLIDDDVHLPANLPLVTHRITGNTKCIGYTIKSTGANGAKGTLIQQCQDMEYKASGLGRTFSGKYGSATFPHGAIILWERECLQNLFNVHPGFVISEDWYFGHCARASGCRIEFCSQVFVETETPPALFKSSSAARGGFGEMTVYKQRFYRWNYFFVHRIYDDGAYLLLSWRLGWREIVTKFYVLIELYDSCMAILRPWIVILTLIGDAKLFFVMSAALTVMYCLIFSWFNAWHLRKKNEMIQWRVLPVYLGMKFVLLWVTCASVYYSLFHYAIYFMKKHPRVIESTRALEAAYNVRLGTALVPLDRPMNDTPVVEEMDTGLSSDAAAAESMSEKEQHFISTSEG